MGERRDRRERFKDANKRKGQTSGILMVDRVEVLPLVL